MQPIVDIEMGEIVVSIGERISALRTEKELSQGELAQLLGVSRQAVSKWESDKSSPDTLNLIKLCEVLDTEVEYLATGRKPVYESPAIVVNVAEKVDKVVEKVVEKPVIKRVIRVKYLRNPVEFLLAGICGLVVGLLLGLLY